MSKLYHRIRAAFSDPLRRLQISVVLLVLLIALGTMMYILLESMTPVNALYMTVITLATVGYGEVQPLSETGRLFTTIFILLGVGVATAVVSNAIGVVVGPLLWSSIRRRRMEQMLNSMEEHYIVCGYGRMGQQIVKDLRVRGERFVILDSDPSTEEHFLAEQMPFQIGDATADEMLLAAGVERARGFVAALNSDAGNVMTVLSARELNPKLFIVARAVRPESESKLRRAGANRVINPYRIGGHRITISLLRPAVDNFLTNLFHFGDGPKMEVGQVRVALQSPLAGKTVATSGLRQEHEVTILAIQQPDGTLMISPSPHQPLDANTTLIIIGTPEAIYALEKAGVNGG